MFLFYWGQRDYGIWGNTMHLYDSIYGSHSNGLENEVHLCIIIDDVTDCS